MNVINQKYVSRTIVSMEERHPVELNGRDHFVHEPFAGCIDNVQAGEVVEQTASDGMDEMSFANADAAVDKERVVAARRHGSDSLSGCVRQLIRGPDDVGIEG